MDILSICIIALLVIGAIMCCYTWIGIIIEDEKEKTNMQSKKKIKDGSKEVKKKDKKLNEKQNKNQKEKKIFTTENVIRCFIIFVICFTISYLLCWYDTNKELNKTVNVISASIYIPSHCPINEGNIKIKSIPKYVYNYYATDYGNDLILFTEDNLKKVLQYYNLVTIYDIREGDIIRFSDLSSVDVFPY